MMLSLFKRNSEALEKEMDDFIDKDDQDDKKTEKYLDNKLTKTLRYLQDLINI